MNVPRPTPRPRPLSILEQKQNEADAKKIEEAHKFEAVDEVVLKKKPVPARPKGLFVRQPHLKDRALRNHPGLIELKAKITTQNKPSTKTN